MNCPQCGGATRIYGTEELFDGALVRRRRRCKRAGCWLRFATREEAEPGSYLAPPTASPHALEGAEAAPTPTAPAPTAGAALGTRLREGLDRALPRAGRADGYFTASDALADGCGPTQLHRFLQHGAVARLGRGLYRLAHLPPSRHESAVVAWLWAGREGVAHGRTALGLLGLLEPAPGEPVELLVPQAWRPRLRRSPDGIVLRRVDELPVAEAGAAIPTSSAARALADALAAGGDVAELRAAALEGVARGLVDRETLDREAKRAGVDGRVLVLHGVALRAAQPRAFESAAQAIHAG